MYDWEMLERKLLPIYSRSMTSNTSIYGLPRSGAEATEKVSVRGWLREIHDGAEGVLCRCVVEQCLSSGEARCFSEMKHPL